jgi:LmbE family N-acetylglucosaminyl deacetylase
MDENEWIAFLEEHLDMEKYDAIFYPSYDDIHFEHRFVASIGRSLGRNNAYKLIEYQTPSTAANWVPNLVSDITLFFEDKVRMLIDHFDSQGDKSYFQPSTLEAFHRHYRWMRNSPGLQYAEEFKITRMFV